MYKISFYIGIFLLLVLVSQLVGREQSILFLIVVLLLAIIFRYYKKYRKTSQTHNQYNLKHEAKPYVPAIEMVIDAGNLTPSVAVEQDIEVFPLPKKLASWVYDEKVPKDIAEGLIKDATWWLTHRYGPVQAPNHYKRIKLSKVHGWSIDFGANTFLVGKAIQRSKQVLLEAEKAFFQKENISIADIKKSLENIVCGAVANKSGVEYYSYPINKDGELVFGAQAIDVKQALNYIVRASGVLLILEDPQN